MPITVNGQPKSKVLLTMEHVEAWRKEAEQIRAEIQDLSTKAEAIDAKLAAAALFMGEADAADLVPAKPHWVPISRVKLPRPMTAHVRELFDDGVRLTPSEVVARLAADPEIGARVTENVNNVYTALGRLYNRDQILVRHDDGSYSLAHEANEPPSGSTAGGSGAGEGLHPSLSFNPSPTRHG